MSTKPSVLLPKYVTVPVATGQTTSAEVDIENYDIVGLITPANFDGTTITIHGAAASGGTFYPLAAAHTASTAYTITTTVSIFTPISQLVTAGLRYIKLVCGTTQTTSDTNLILVLRPKS